MKVRIVGIDPDAKQHPDCASVWVTPAGRLYKQVNARHPERRQVLDYKPEIDKDGYLKFAIAGKKRLAHRLVYELFVGPLDPQLVVCHRDGDPKNNHFSNLLQATQKVNIAHQVAHGTRRLGEQHPCSKITNEQAKQIRSMLSQAGRTSTGRLRRGEALRIARELQVSIHIVHDISAESKASWSKSA